MSFWNEYGSSRLSVSLLLLTLFVIAAHSLPTQSGAKQTDSFHRRRRTAMDNELALQLLHRGDLDNDDFLSPSEITHFYENVIGFPSNLASFMATGFMRNGDRNGDHQLDYSETLTAIQTIEG